MYNIHITSHAERNLKRLDRSTKSRISTTILTLAAVPRPTGCLKVKDEAGLWRVRVGDYRIGYEINDMTQEVTIIRIGHRREFYE